MKLLKSNIFWGLRHRVVWYKFTDASQESLLTCLTLRPRDGGSISLRNVGEIVQEYWLLGLLFNPEGGGSTFLRNVAELLPDYMALHSKR
jgi:hypothetical protein